MPLTYFANDLYTVHIERRPRSIGTIAVIILHSTDSRYLARFAREDGNWTASVVINCNRVEAQGRTQIVAAIALALAIGRIVLGIDLDEAQAEHDRASRIDPCPSMDEQDRECEAEHLARMLDRD